jgi:hypothetical protein
LLPTRSPTMPRSPASAPAMSRPSRTPSPRCWRSARRRAWSRSASSPSTAV